MSHSIQTFKKTNWNYDTMRLVLVPRRLKALASLTLSNNALDLKGFQGGKKKNAHCNRKIKKLQKSFYYEYFLNSSRNIPVFGGQWSTGRAAGDTFSTSQSSFHQRFPVD